MRLSGWTLIFPSQKSHSDRLLANLFDDKMMNGFECYFYPNQGLRFLTELKNGKQMDVTSWDKNGGNERKIPFHEWTKIISNTKLLKESQ